MSTSIRRLKRSFRKHAALKNVSLGLCLIFVAWGFSSALMRTDIFAGAVGALFLALFFIIYFIK